MEMIDERKASDFEEETENLWRGRMASDVQEAINDLWRRRMASDGEEDIDDVRRKKASGDSRSSGFKEEASRVRKLCLKHPRIMVKIKFEHSRTVLHKAAEHGQTTSVTRVLKVNPRLARIRDEFGSSPLHIAAKRGNVDICLKLLAAAPETCHWQNSYGMTPRHMAERGGHFEICRILKRHEIKERDRQHIPFAMRLRLVNEFLCSTYEKIMDAVLSSNEAKNRLPVLVGLAGTTFHLLHNPPGGKWREDNSSHKAGDAIIASTRPDIYNFFVFATRIAFSSALLAIILITIGWPSRSNFLRHTASAAIWVSLIAITMSYVGSTMAIAPHTNSISVNPVLLIAVMLVSIIITLLISASYPLTLIYLGRGRNKLLQEDLIINHLPKHVLYQILQLLETLILLSASLCNSLADLVRALSKPFELSLM